MKFKIIDYSDIYFKTISKTDVPSKRGGNFIQIMDEDTEYLVLSPAGLSSFHANIAERFCLLKGIEGAYTTKRMDKYEIYDPEWIIIGGGKWVIDEKEKRFHLFAESGTYGKFDSRGLRKKILATERLVGYEVKISR
jgi:hypothetical protein